MAFNKLQIYNLCLRFLGDTRIDDIGERTAAREKIDDVYDFARIELLERHEWDFATRVEELAQLADEDDPKWAYTYLLPKGYLHPQRIETELFSVGSPGACCCYDRTYYDNYSFGSNIPRVPFEIRNQKLYCNLDKVYFRYTINETDEVKYSSLFCKALALLCAEMLAPGTLGDVRAMGQYKQAAELVLGEAEARDAKGMQYDHDSDLDKYNHARG
jgi:hypothetical protein